MEQARVSSQVWLAVSEIESGPPAESALLRAALAGDRAALGELLERHQRPLIRFCFGILGNIEDAEDAAQETFLRVLDGLSGFRGDSAFRTWLYRIAVNVCLRWKAARRPTEPLDDERDVAGSRLLPPEAIALGRLQQMEALRTLPPRQRVIFLLKEWEGWSVAEIAVATRWTPNRVKTELSNARRTLVEWRRKMEEGEAR
jgi:RNA polymerase sigma-70 factor (ECF subfamily)